MNRILHEFAEISYLISPLIVGLAFHGCCIKFGLLSKLARPIDHGKMLNNKPLFGSNKTYRGVVAVALGTAAGFGIQMILHSQNLLPDYELIPHKSFASILIGFGMGAAAMLAELPNSLLKRQLGIEPGGVASGIRSVIFYVLDQVDLLIGVWLVIWPFVDVTVLRLLLSVAFLFIAHQIISVLGYHLGMRSTAR
jgi:hypothetical protein